MRDGIELALDLVCREAVDPRPVVLVRTPYDKTAFRKNELYVLLAQHGYIVAIGDCRGRFNSDGVFRPFFGECEDGYDTVEWIARQHWCDGNVGMIGNSYGGVTQWYAASLRPPHLKAIVPISSPPDSLWANEPFLGGCFMVGWSEFLGSLGRRSWQTDIREIYAEQQAYFDVVPVSEMFRAAGFNWEFWDEAIQHPRYDEFWEQTSYGGQATLDLATLNVAGWWDMNFPGAPSNFEAMRDAPGSARRKLVIGPWPHAVNRERELNGVDFGEQAVIALGDYVVRFFDRWLRHIDNGIDREQPVHIFVVGANEWWTEDDWPLPGTRYVPYYLRSGGSANTSAGDGRLTLSPPDAEPPDEYVYDPEATARILWKMSDGPVDDSAVTARDDCLCYTTEPLDEAIDVVGWVACRLYAASSALDTDWHVRLVDVYPDGAARFICNGALRALFRDSVARPRLLTPDEPVLFEIPMNACGIRFAPGHRIRLEVMSAWFTQYDRNRNTGAENFFTDRGTAVARQRVYHDAPRPSCLVLPVIPKRD
jgi:putative CocE/NonD family hydrolase